MLRTICLQYMLLANDSGVDSSSLFPLRVVRHTDGHIHKATDHLIQPPAWVMR